MQLLSKDQFITELRRVMATGWVPTAVPVNGGGVGTTLRELVRSQWELKTHSRKARSPLTLINVEPQPTNLAVVPHLLLPNYGWAARSGGDDGFVFRQTLRATAFSQCGFKIAVERDPERVVVVFDPTKVAPQHGAWLKTVENRVGLDALHPQPYWDMQDLALRITTKMLNFFLIAVDTARTGEGEIFQIRSVRFLQGFSFDRFVEAIQNGTVFVDFDARAHHNHGTKYRIREHDLPALYKYVDTVA